MCSCCTSFGTYYLRYCNLGKEKKEIGGIDLKKQKKQLIILIALLVVMLLALVLVRFLPSGEEEEETVTYDVTTLDSSEVTEMSFTNENGTFSFVKNGKQRHDFCFDRIL